MIQDSPAFGGQAYWANAAGICQPLVGQLTPLANSPLRLYRFLTHVEDILLTVQEDEQRLQLLCPLVQRLLADSPWLAWPDLVPDPVLGWGVQTLYDEPFYPLTVQRVAWSPGAKSPIHNHGAWGIVAMLDGQEQNTFWQDSPAAAIPPQLEPGVTLTLSPGDILGLMPETIHHVEALSPHPTLSFNIYGETNYDQRWEFDPLNGTASLF
ncbi:cysteine dioxygenase family protein [Pseudocalidococcus azoricus]|nr:cupin [Pseudocalidococcus azoricus]